MSTPRRSVSKRAEASSMDDPSYTWEKIAGCRTVVPRHVVHRQFAAETVLLNVETGHYYGMDTIGARFFAVLQGSGTVQAAVHTLTAEFEGPPDRIREDMVKFCEELVSKGLLELTGPGG